MLSPAAHAAVQASRSREAQARSVSQADSTLDEESSMGSSSHDEQATIEEKTETPLRQAADNIPVPTRSEQGVTHVIAVTPEVLSAPMIWDAKFLQNPEDIKHFIKKAIEHSRQHSTVTKFQTFQGYFTFGSHEVNVLESILVQRNFLLAEDCGKGNKVIEALKAFCRYDRSIKVPTTVITKRILEIVKHQGPTFQHGQEPETVIVSILGVVEMCTRHPDVSAAWTDEAQALRSRDSSRSATPFHKIAYDALFKSLPFAVREEFLEYVSRKGIANSKLTPSTIVQFLEECGEEIQILLRAKLVVCGFCKKPNHTEADCRAKLSKDKSPTKPGAQNERAPAARSSGPSSEAADADRSGQGVRCYQCQKYGHRRSECPQNKTTKVAAITTITEASDRDGAA